MIENLIDRIAKSETRESQLKLAAIQLLVNSQVDFTISLEPFMYYGMELYRAEKKFLVIERKFCSCVFTKAEGAGNTPACKHIIAVATRHLNSEMPLVAFTGNFTDFVSKVYSQ